MGGAEAHAGLGHPGARGAGSERDPEVGHQGTAVVQQDVLGLDVAVNDAVPVGVIERPGHLGGNPHRLGNRQLLLALEPLAQRLPRHERHRVPEQPVHLAGVDQAEDVRVLEVGGDLDLLEEPLGTDDGGEFRSQHLEGDLALVAEVVSQVDGGHAAGTELPVDAVAVGQGGLQAVGNVGQRGSSAAGSARWARECERKLPLARHRRHEPHFIRTPHPAD